MPNSMPPPPNHPLDYRASPPSTRRWRKLHAIAFASGALPAALLITIYIIQNGGVPVFQPGWGAIAFWPGYQFGTLFYEHIFGWYDLCVGLGIAVTILTYGLVAVLLFQAFAFLKR
jgi:hypothetical protein